MKYFFGLSYRTDEAKLRWFLEQHGIEASSVIVITNRETGESRGFGFVTSDNPKVLKLNGKMLDGRELRVSVAKEREPGQMKTAGGRR